MANAVMVAERIASSTDEDRWAVVETIEKRVGFLPQVELSYEPGCRLLWITMRPEPKPVVTLPLIESIRNIQLAVWEIWGRSPERPILFMACRSRGRVYSLGGDLDFYLDCLARNDRAGLQHYADAACDVIRMSRNGLFGSVITLSNVHARIMGGAIDSARSCNIMVAEEGATFCYPEVNYNHYPIAAVPILSRHAGPVEAERILLSGRDYAAEEFERRGVADAVLPAGEGDDWIRRYCTNGQASHAARIALIAAFNRMAGDIDAELAAAGDAWVSHILTLKPLEISKLQRIAAAQERMLGRLLRSEPSASGVR